MGGGPRRPVLEISHHSNSHCQHHGFSSAPGAIWLGIDNFGNKLATDFSAPISSKSRQYTVGQKYGWNSGNVSEIPAFPPRILFPRFEFRAPFPTCSPGSPVRPLPEGGRGGVTPPPRERGLACGCPRISGAASCCSTGALTPVPRPPVASRRMRQCPVACVPPPPQCFRSDEKGSNLTSSNHRLFLILTVPFRPWDVFFCGLPHPFAPH